VKGGGEMSNIIEKLIAESTDGLVKVTDVEAYGGDRRALKYYVNNNKLMRVGRGLYQITDEWEDDLYILSVKYPKGIVSHETALYIHGFTDRTPAIYSFTFPQGYNAPSLKNENVIIKRVVQEKYSLGLSDALSFSGNPIRVYNIERTLCDIVRGEGSDIQIVLDAMKRYAKYENKNINLLMDYAEQLHVKKKILRYMEVLL
jgi:predicted transcriptional regulator of viral defense system